MRTVLLYGHLARQFGKYHRFDVQSPAEAVRALRVNFKGFEQAMLSYGPGFHVFHGKENLGREGLRQPSGKDAIRIVPALAGAKRGGILQIIEGIVLIVVGSAVSYFSDGLASELGGDIARVGAAMALGGIATFLFAPPIPNANPNEANANNQPSYVFSGPVNTTAQGHPVPVGYGKLEVGSAVISGGIYVAQIGTNGNATATGPTDDPTGSGSSDVPTFSDANGGSLGGGVLRVGPTISGIQPITPDPVLG